MSTNAPGRVSARRALRWRLPYWAQAALPAAFLLAAPVIAGLLCGLLYP